MPSLRKSLFKRRGNSESPSNVAVSVDKSGREVGSSAGGDRSVPVDPDGSTASHSSNEIYISEPSSPAALPAVDPPASPAPEPSVARWTDERKQSSSRTKRGKNCETKSREGVPIITASGADHFSPSAVSSRGNYATEGFYSKSKKTFAGKERPKVRPSAKSSAFGGAPRYDWMDIETTAAIKIQAAYRRLRVQNYLDEQNLSTPGMRNRRAQRRARLQSRGTRVASADVPFPFNLCGVGLIFGDVTLEDEAVTESLERKRLARAKAEKEREDAEKRRFHFRKKDSCHLEEGLEVVESFEGEEEEADGGARETEQAQKSPNRLGRSLARMRSRKSSKSPISPASPRIASQTSSSGRRKSIKTEARASS